MEYRLPNHQKITHPALVAALSKSGADILATLTPQKADAWHMASCIPGEAGELFEPLRANLNGAGIDRVNIVEELGDLEFYLQGLKTSVGFLPHDGLWLGPVGDAMSFLALPGRAADVFDVVKKWVIYNKPLDEAALLAALESFDAILTAIRFSFGITREETLGANVWKLGTRYEGIAYSDAAAQARADKTIH